MATINKGVLRRQVILEFLKTYHAIHSYMPNYREIGAASGLRSVATVQHQLNLLQRDGFIIRDYATARGIRVLEKAS